MCKFKTNNSLIHEEVNQYLESIIETKLFANGYIFYGAEGIGKKETALNFVKQIFKQYSSNGNVEEKINNKNHPDFLIIEPSSFFKDKPAKSLDSQKAIINNMGLIKIEQIRDVKTFLNQKSIESEKKIVLIVDAHLLNEAASNCLLKTLEEPNNGIFILLTSKLNLLLDTITSRCQLIRFKSFSSTQLDYFLQNNLDPSMLEIAKNLNSKDLVNSANGSPGNLFKNIEIWQELSEEITNKLHFPLKDNWEILKVCKSISEKLEIYQQICLINLIQQIWWRKTRNINLVKKLETLKSHIKNHIQPRLAWEVTLLKIAIEDL